MVSRAQGEYEQLEKEKEKDGKRELEDGGEGAREVKRVKADADGDDDEMEIEMEDDEDGRSPCVRYNSRTDGDLAMPKENGSGKATLVCTNLPPECTEDIMGALFSQWVPHLPLFCMLTPLDTAAFHGLSLCPPHILSRPLIRNPTPTPNPS